VEETKTVTETIKYVYENGDQAATPKVQKLDFKRTNTKDLVTGKISQEGVWAPSTGTFSEVVSPTVDGYTPDKSKVDAVTITAAHSDIHVTVTYKADKQKVTYTIIDDTAHKTLKDKE
ncbi:mucin-binding protein, partial [Streptococcus sp. HMSC067A03]